MIWIEIQIVGMFFLFILSGFFSSSEVAYTGLTARQIKRIKKISQKSLLIWEHHPDRVLATLLLSNNAVNAGVGVLSASLAVHFAQATGLGNSLATLILGFVSGTVLLLGGEIIPKIWARRYTVSWALRVTPVIALWTKIVSPLANAFVSMTDFVLISRHRKRKIIPFIRHGDLHRILRHAVIPVSHRKILNNVIDFSKDKVSDVMTHRADIFAVSLQQPREKLLLSVIRSGLSRIPVYSGTLDNIVGILYAKDLLVAWRSGTIILLEDLLRPVRYVEKDMLISELLRIFRTGHQHLAIVTDKNKKRVKGLVTIQDVLEEIVGRIRGED